MSRRGYGSLHGEVPIVDTVIFYFLFISSISVEVIVEYNKLIMGR